MIQYLKQVDGVDVSFGCNDECYGERTPFWNECSNCIKQFQRGRRSEGDDRVVVPVVGAAIHIYKALNRQLNLTMEQFELFVNATENVIFNSSPSYQIAKVPEDYRNSTKGNSLYYWSFLPHIEKYHSRFRFLDFFQLTGSCTMEHCSTDGGHRSRFVNRWKAQLLLNTLCSYGTG
jgi:hypothetical protein